MHLNPLNAELNPIRHLLALVEAHHSLDDSGVSVNLDTKLTSFYGVQNLSLGSQEFAITSCPD